jgi:hypothetical protein
VQYLEAYRESIDGVSETVNSSVADMNALLSKCQELNENLKPAEQLAAQMYVCEVLSVVIACKGNIQFSVSSQPRDQTCIGNI